MKKIIALMMVLAASIAANAAMEITEWMYSGGNGEFIEFTNTGSTSVDMTGWSYSDTDRTAGDLSLSAFGIVAPGQSVILTETAEATFRSAWGLSASVKIIGSNTNSNLGRADEINLYDGSALVDSLVFDDAAGKGLRTQYKSCNIPAAEYGVTTAKSSWILSAVGDSFGSWKSSGNDIGTPGVAAVPEPMTMILLGLGGLLFIRGRKM
jgi:predicted extracellular nuclease